MKVGTNPTKSYRKGEFSMKKILAIALAAMMVLSLCSFAMAEDAKGADVKGTGVELTIYTNSGSSGLADLL